MLSVIQITSIALIKELLIRDYAHKICIAKLFQEMLTKTVHSVFLNVGL